MPHYLVKIAPPAARSYKKLPPAMVVRVARALLALETEPRGSDSKKLAGEANAYRVRVGDYRLVYEVYDAIVTVVVIRIAHRREVYR